MTCAYNYYFAPYLKLFYQYRNLVHVLQNYVGFIDP